MSPSKSRSASSSKKGARNHKTRKQANHAQPLGKPTSPQRQKPSNKPASKTKATRTNEASPLQKAVGAISDKLFNMLASKRVTQPAVKTVIQPAPAPTLENTPAIQSACSAEPASRNGRPDFVAACVLYLLFALLLWGVHLYSPERLALSAGPLSAGLRIPAEMDLSGRQPEFEELWRNSLIQMGLNPDTLGQTVSGRFMEKRRGENILKWVRGTINLTLPPAKNEAQLIAVGNKWKECCEKFGYTVTQTHWGLARQKIWVRLESTVEVQWHEQPLQISIQQITLSQPVGAYPGSLKKKKWNLEGLIPVTLPDMEVQPPPQKAAPPSLVPASKPVEATVPTPTVTPKPSQTPQPEPKAQPSSKSRAQSEEVMAPRGPVGKIKAKMAIVIDDVGYLRGPAEVLLKAPARLTWSVLPFSTYCSQLAEAGRTHGFQIMLHLPLEPIDQVHNNPGPGVIRIGWSEDEVRKQLDEDLQVVPGAVGINNHMGSAGTADDRLMASLMGYVKEKGLFFIDSETTSHSLAEKYARQNGVATARRDVFIDNQSSIESKKEQIRELIKMALKNGSAIGIGHTRPGTGEAILEMLPEITEAGIEIVPVSELVR